MSTSFHLAPYLRRFLILLVISILAIWAISEIGILLQGEAGARAPETVELIIPDGTAAQVEAGEDPPGIPDELAFVLGDTLLVRNQDSVAHTLGPLFIPPDTSASLLLEEPDKYSLTCSFRPSKYLGLNVDLPTTLGTRLVGIGFAVPPTVAILFVYSLLVYPIKPPEGDPAPEAVE